MKIFCSILFLLTLPVLIHAQETTDKEKDKLGDKEYIIVKDYKPVLGESQKISDSPEGDTTSANPPAMEYNVRAKKASSEYETSVIKAVKIKDEQLAKLYRSYLKLGLGNYTTYYGDLYVNALRSKKGAVGIALNHYSGSPGLKDAGPAGFSKNHGGVYGKYFFDNSTFTGNIDYNRDVIHYYGYNTDTVISKNAIKQRFNKFGMQVGLASNYLNKDHLDYAATFGYSIMNDSHDASEYDFLVAGKIGKKVNDFYVNGDISFDYFKKSRGNGEMLDLENDLSRNIITLAPSFAFNKEKINLVLGLNLGIEKNLETDLHLFPKIDLTLPIAEHILYIFAGVNGNIIKNTYQTIAEENPFVTSYVRPLNTINKLELKGGVHGNFSQKISFMMMVKYSSFENMQLFINDSIYFNKFNTLYKDGDVLDIHAELSYKSSEKFNIALRFDQYNYTMNLGEKAWHRPANELALNAKYNLWDKFIIKADLFAIGKYDVRITNGNSFTSEKVNGYFDANLGIDYRYSKILSVFVNLNNLGFARYYRWYNYPSERFNALGGITFSF